MKIVKIISHLFLLLLAMLRHDVFARSKIVMLDPAGDARQRGRTLSNGYERGETLKFAQAFERELRKYLRCEVVIARTLGEEKLPLQVPTLANRLNVDLFVHVSFYHETSSKPKAYFYQLTYNSLLDFAPRSYQQPSFVPIDQAHFKNIHTTKMLASTLKSFLQEKHSRLLDVYGPFGLPLKPLEGIMSPALLIEIGIHDDDQWESLITPLTESLFFFLQK